MILTQVKDVPIEKHVCVYYQNEFPQGQFAVGPFDIVISHKKRWLYLKRNRNADSQPLYIPSSVKKLTDKYYCIRRKCIYNRFPYFLISLFYSATIKGKWRDHFNRKWQKDNQGAAWCFHLNKEVNYLTFYFARSFFYHTPLSQIKATTAIGVHQI